MKRYEGLFILDTAGKEEALKDTIDTWCSPRQCILETTSLLEGARLRISGPDDMVREAMRMVRLWMHRTT